MIPGAKGRICRQHGATNRRTTALPSGAPGAISATKALRVGPPGAWQHPAAPKRAGAMIGAPDGGSGGFLKDGIARVLGSFLARAERCLLADPDKPICASVGAWFSGSSIIEPPEELRPEIPALRRPGSDGHHGALVVRGFCNLGGRLPRHSGMVARAAAVAVSANATLKARQRPAPPD